MNDQNAVRFSFSLRARRPAPHEPLLVPLTSDARPPASMIQAIDRLCGQALSRLLAATRLAEQPGQLLHTASDGAYRRLLVVGLGPAHKLDGQAIRTAAGAATRALNADPQTARQAALWVDGLLGADVEDAVGQWCLGMMLGGFRFLEHRREPHSGPRRIDVLLRSVEPARLRPLESRLREVQAVAEGVNYARRLAHEPPNVVHPQSLAAEARRLGRRTGLRVTVLAGPRLRRLGMGGLLAVGGAASRGPCLIRLDYSGAPRSRTRTVVIGKAITFDTGGYSIKPAEGMSEMKFDKCGGTAVLGLIQAAADLRLRCNLTGLVAAAENAISQRAYRPADIVRMMSGQTVEVISTDAEGRLVLADAITYAQRFCRPTELIDLATLTGGARVALGSVAAGLMSNHDDLAAALEESGRRTHERLWRLPLWEDYRELIRGTDSDLRNASGKRDAQTIVGGMFLREFVDPRLPWAHIDIAAVATQEAPGSPGKVATGFGVRLLLDYLARRGA